MEEDLAHELQSLIAWSQEERWLNLPTLHAIVMERNPDLKGQGRIVRAMKQLVREAIEAIDQPAVVYGGTYPAATLQQAANWLLKFADDSKYRGGDINRDHVKDNILCIPRVRRTFIDKAEPDLMLLVARNILGPTGPYTHRYAYHEATTWFNERHSVQKFEKLLRVVSLVDGLESIPIDRTKACMRITSIHGAEAKEDAEKAATSHLHFPVPLRRNQEAIITFVNESEHQCEDELNDPTPGIIYPHRVPVDTSVIRVELAIEPRRLWWFDGVSWEHEHPRKAPTGQIIPESPYRHEFHPKPHLMYGMAWDR